MTDDRAYGHTGSGKPITDADIDALVTEAEAGYDMDELLSRRGERGRPTLGSGPANVESVRLDSDLREALTERAERDHETTSAVIRKALRQYLEAA